MNARQFVLQVKTEGKKSKIVWNNGEENDFDMKYSRRSDGRLPTQTHCHPVTLIPNCSAVVLLAANIGGFARQNNHASTLPASFYARYRLAFGPGKGGRTVKNLEHSVNLPTMPMEPLAWSFM